MNDPLEELRKRWQELVPPAADGRREDPLEQATLDWMRSAWATLEAPEPRPMAQRRVTGLPRQHMFAALAAASLVALFLGVLQSRLSRTPPNTLNTAAPLAAKLDPVQVTPLGDGQMELRRGRVRLILIDN